MELDLDVGKLSAQQFNLMLNRLPVDITYVDEKDEVKYFNKIQDRIFKRTESVIGKKVQDCHPEKSLGAVEKILDDFKKKKKDVGEFWIKLDQKLIHIRYYPLYGPDQEYKGCIEVTQDITHIKTLKGEKRLL